MRLRHLGRGRGIRSSLIRGPTAGNRYHRTTAGTRARSAAYSIRPRGRWLAPAVLQVQQQGAHRLLVVVEAQVAVLVRTVEPPQQARAVPGGEVLRALLGVLQRRQERQRAADRLGVAL